MMQPHIRATLFATALAACVTQPARPSFDDAAIEAACTQLAQAECGVRMACSYQDYNVLHVFMSDADCVARTELTCINAHHVADINSTLMNVMECATNTISESCADFFDNNPSTRCANVPGPGAIGSPCANNLQCASTYCAVLANAVCGTCQAVPQPGAPCTATSECGRDLACEIPSGATSGSCAAFANTTQPCLTGSIPCVSGDSCVGDVPASSTTGKCQPSGRTVDTLCDTSRATMPTCDGTYGLACIAATGTIGTCQAIKLVGANAQCGTFIDQGVKTSHQCVADGACVKMTGAATATCEPAAADGAACAADPTVGPPCASPAICVVGVDGVNGTCQVPDPAACF